MSRSQRVALTMGGVLSLCVLAGVPGAQAQVIIPPCSPDGTCQCDPAPVPTCGEETITGTFVRRKPNLKCVYQCTATSQCRDKMCCEIGGQQGPPAANVWPSADTTW